MTDWNREYRELSLTFFMTGIIGLMVIGGMYIMIQVDDFIFTLITTPILLFIIPIIFTIQMLNYYERKFPPTKVMDCE